MPELPEVETIVRELQDCLPGKKVCSIQEHYQGTVRIDYNKDSLTDFLNQPTAGIIQSICRRGKYIIINLTADLTLIVHLRMTGKLILCRNSKKSGFEIDSAKHVRATLHFSDGSSLIFNDPRTFGKIDVLSTNDAASCFCKLGCEPLTAELNYQYLADEFSKKKIVIKKALLNQDIIAGIGNIYANEILYRSKINPLKPVNELSTTEIKTLINEIKSVLTQAINCNGTTISDYRRVDDKQGRFQDFLKVYGKGICPQNHSLIRVKADGRSTYYCPVCQK